ncbi:MAG: hypothetical protein ACKOWR_04865 [Micrococcales bacterium]
MPWRWSQITKNTIFFIATGIIVVNVIVAYTWRAYPYTVFGLVSLAALVVSFVFAILALTHKFSSQQGNFQILRALLVVLVVVLYPLFYTILGFMTIGLGSGQGS